MKPGAVWRPEDLDIYWPKFWGADLSRSGAEGGEELV